MTIRMTIKRADYTTADTEIHIYDQRVDGEVRSATLDADKATFQVVQLRDRGWCYKDGQRVATARRRDGDFGHTFWVGECDGVLRPHNNLYAALAQAMMAASASPEDPTRDGGELPLSDDRYEVAL